MTAKLRVSAGLMLGVSLAGVQVATAQPHAIPAQPQATAVHHHTTTAHHHATKATHHAAAAPDPLQNGRLVVWVIRPTPPKKPKVIDLPRYRAPQPGYHEATVNTLGQTAGSYGHDAATYGVDASSSTISAPAAGQVTNAAGGSETLAPAYREQDAGSYGQTAGSYGKTAGSYGQTAGSYGKTAGSVGTEASNYGEPASKLGQTAGSFGARERAEEIARESKQRQAEKAEAAAAAAAKPLHQSIETALATKYPGLKTQFSEVGDDHLQAELRKAAAEKRYPDALLFEGFPSAWGGPSAEVRRLQQQSASGAAVARENEAGDGKLHTSELVVLHHAPHPKTAKAFVVYLNGQSDWTSAAR